MKIIKKSIFNLIIFIMLGFIFYSCSETCQSLLTENRKVKLIFKQNKNNSLADTLVNFIYICNYLDTIFYGGAPASKIGLPLAQNFDSSTFILTTDSLTSMTKDTITFYYDRKLETESSECGFNTVFSLIDVDFTKHRIDTIIKHITDVNSDVDYNYKLVFRKNTL